jgi:histidine triad (HIT) family protein
VRCIFCSIIAGAEPASRVYEDEHILAFLDIRPVRPGQLLVIPKQHVDHFDDLPDELALRIVQVGKNIATAMRRTLRPKRVGMIVHGFGVPHAHLIVLPLEHPWDITSAANAYIENGTVKFRWDQVPEADRADLDAMAQRLAATLKA